MKKRKLRKWVICALDLMKVTLIFCLSMQALWVACLITDKTLNGVMWVIARLCYLLFGIKPI